MADFLERLSNKYCISDNACNGRRKYEMGLVHACNLEGCVLRRALRPLGPPPFQRFVSRHDFASDALNGSSAFDGSSIL